jgi:hypothetical protein
MSTRPGHVEVVTEAGFCNFCNRTRNLRREEHHLGGLVRTIVSCETCHRTLSNTMGVAAAEPEQLNEETPAPAPAPAPAVTEEKPKPKRAPAKRTITAKAAAAKKPATRAKPKTPPKPRSTATTKRSTTKRK